jgi:hypothetical protein
MDGGLSVSERSDAKACLDAGAGPLLAVAGWFAGCTAS